MAVPFGSDQYWQKQRERGKGLCENCVYAKLDPAIV